MSGASGHTPGPLELCHGSATLQTTDGKVVMTFNLSPLITNARHVQALWDLDPEAVQRLVDAVDEVLAWMRGPTRAYGLETERWEAYGLEDEYVALEEARAAFSEVTT